MEFNGLKKAYRYLAVLLCTVLTLTSPLTSAAAQELPGTAPSSVSEGDVHDKETNEKFTVKVSRALQWDNIEERPYSAGTDLKIQVDGKGVVEKKADGGYHVRLGYAGFSIYDAIQVVDPKKNADVFQYNADRRLQGERLAGIMSFPNGTFNAPKSAESCIDPMGFSGSAGIESKIREEVNSYYLPEDKVKITCLDSAMDWGGIEFDVDSLSDYIIIKPLSSMSQYTQGVIVGFDEASLTPVPDSLTREPDSYDMGYEWTNLSKGIKSTRYGYLAPAPYIGVRGDEEGKGGGSVDGKIGGLLDNIFEKDVKVIAAEDGTLSAVLKVNMNIYDNIYLDSADTPDPVSSISWSKKRDTSISGIEKIGTLNWIKSDISNEILGNTWVPISHQETVIIPFKDLMEGKLIRITTKAQEEKNAVAKNYRKEQHYWGRLWLTKSVKKDATEVIKTAANGAVLKTDTDTFKPGDRFVCTELSTFGDEPTMENMFSTVKDEDSYRIYSYQIQNGRGERKNPKSPITVDLPIPATVNHERLWFITRPNIPEEVAHQSTKNGIPSGAEVVQNEQGDWVLRITPPDLSAYDDQVCMFDTGERMTWQEMQALERGKYYELRGLIVHEGGNMPSMSSPILRNKKVYLHVTEDGKFELYAKLKGIYVAQYGHIAQMSYFTSDGTLLPVDILSYKTAANVRDVEWEDNRRLYPDWTTQRSEDDLTPDMVAKEAGCHYLDVIKLPLDEPKGSPYWKLDFVVPLMNMVLSGGDSSKYLRDAKQARLVLAAGSAKEVDPSEVYSYDKSLLLGTIEDVQKYYDTLQEGTEKDELKVAIDKAKATYQELKVSFDKDKLLEAVKELKAAGKTEAAPILSAGTYQVPFKINKVNADNEDSGTASPYMDYFDSAVLTVNDKTMTVKLAVKAVNGVSVQSLQYIQGSGGYKEAAQILDDHQNVIGYTFTQPYSEKAVRMQLSMSSIPYPVRVFLSMDFTAAEAEKDLLKAALDGAKGYLSQTDKYTEASIEALQTAVNGAESIYSSYDGSDTAVAAAEAAIKKMKAATDLLKEKSGELKGSMKALKELLDSLEKHDAATYEAASKNAFEASRKAALAILDVNRGYEVSEAQAAAQLDALNKERAALIDSDSLTSLSKERMLSFYAVPYEPKEDEAISKKAVSETAEVPQSKQSPETPEKTADKSKIESSTADGTKTDDKKDKSDRPTEGVTEGASIKEKSADDSVKETAKTSAKETTNASVGEMTKAVAEETAKDSAGETAKASTEETAKDSAGETAKVSTEETVKDSAGETAKVSTEETAKDSAGETTKDSAETKSGGAADSSRTEEVKAQSITSSASKSFKPYFRLMSIASSSDSERGVVQTDSKAETQAATEAAPRVEAQTAPKAEAQTAPKAEAQTAPKAATQAAPKAATQAAPKAETRAAKKEAVNPNKVNKADGIYAIDYILRQFSSVSASMGNPALVDAYPEREGKQAKLEIKDGKAYLYLGFQQMGFSNITGHLLDMVIMDNLKVEDGVISDYHSVAPTVVETTDEKDDYGPPAGKKYPKLLKFDITKYLAAYQDLIPVKVNVPVMGSSADQPAYIQLDYETLQQVEGSEEPDTPEVRADFTQLDEIVAAASKTKGSYTKESFDALAQSLKAAVTLENYANDYYISQDLVDKRTAAVTATAKALIPLKDMPSETITPSGDEVKPGTDNTDRSALGRILMRIAGYKKSDYTPDSHSAMMTAYEAAYSVYDNQDATALELTLAKSRLQNAIDGLKTFTVKKTKLMAAINTAGTLQESSFTPESWLRFTFALSEAKAVAGDAAATQDDVDSVWTGLSQSIDQLASKTSSTANQTTTRNESVSERGKKDKKDGYYKVSVRLWHSNMDKASMGDEAIAKTAYVHIDGGDATMRMVSREMTVSGITAHLHDFWIYRNGDYQEAEMVSSDNDKWVYEFDLPNSRSAYYKCMVDPKVDVMGDDPVKARLKVSWSSLKKVSRSDWDDMSDDDSDSGSHSRSTFTSSQPKRIELTSSETGIKVSGNPGGPGMALEASKMESGDRYDRAVSVLGDKVKRFVLYEISLRSGEKYVEPSGSVTIQIPVPNGYDSRNLSLYRVNDDGSLQEIYGRVNGSYFEASVDHFSLYALGESSQAQNGTAVTQNNPSGAANGTSASGGSQRAAAGTGTKGSAPSYQKTAAKNTVSKETAAAQASAEQAVPYTGDQMPVKSLMGVGILALFIALGTMIPEKGNKKNRWKKGNEN